MIKIKQVTGQCPITNKTETVDAIYHEVNETGSLISCYKLMEIDCEHSSKCSYEICPLVKNPRTS